jgi:hypothetical protein
MTSTESIRSLLSFGYRTEGGVRCLYCSLAEDQLSDAARIIAQNLVERRIGVNTRLRKVWTDQFLDQSSEVISAADQELIIAGVLQNVGTPIEPATNVHLYGLVAEEVWLEVTAGGPPIRVEGHDWSAIDPGGDGLTVYAQNGGIFCFRLWESKHHTGDDPVRNTINLACRQVKSRALSYLSRFALVAQNLTDNPPLATFYGRLAEMWVNVDPAAGVGIVVGTSSADGHAVPFDRLPTYFDFETDREFGQLNALGDFESLARKVQINLWKGAGLWTEP